jgi:hypothetical protein
MTIQPTTRVWLTFERAKRPLCETIFALLSYCQGSIATFPRCFTVCDNYNSGIRDKTLSSVLFNLIMNTISFVWRELWFSSHSLNYFSSVFHPEGRSLRCDRPVENYYYINKYSLMHLKLQARFLGTESSRNYRSIRTTRRYWGRRWVIWLSSLTELPIAIYGRIVSDVQMHRRSKFRDCLTASLHRPWIR